MRGIFLISLLLLAPLASANAVSRTISYDDVYFNNTNTVAYRTAWITLAPSPTSEFDLPGYAVTETIPSSFEIVSDSINADMYKLDGNVLSMIKWSSGDIRYKVKLPKTTATYSIIGSYKDENRNTGTIPSTEIQVTPVPSSSSGSTTKQDDLAWVKPTSEPTKKEVSRAIENQSAVVIETLTASQAQGTGSKSKPANYALAGILGIISVIGTVIVIMKVAKHNVPKKPVIIKIEKSTKGLFINGAQASLPYIIDLQNPHKNGIHVYIKSSSNGIDVRPKTLRIPAGCSNNISVDSVAEGFIGCIEVRKQSEEWVVL